MPNELILKKCQKCNAIVKVINDCNCKDCGLKCCNEPMQIIEPNTTEASIEKHLPTYEIKNNNIIIKINHIMEEKHYIEWISVINNEEIYTKKLTSNDKPKLIYPYKEGTIIYSYCNLHGLWKQEVK